MHRLCSRSLTLSAAFLVASPVLAGDLTIADLAPESAFFIAGVDDFKTWKASFDRAGFGAILEDQRIKDWLEGAGEEFVPQLKEDLGELGIDLEELSWPTGAVGAAAWMNDEDPDNANLLLLVDFGEEAGSMDGMLVEAFERGADRETIELREEEIDGVTVWGVKGIALMDEADFDDLDAGFAGGLAPDQPEEVFYAHQGEYLLLASSIEVMGEAFRVLDGDEIDTVRDSDEFQNIRAHVDANEMYVAFLAEPIFRAMDVANADRQEELPAGAELTLTAMNALGFRDMHGAGMSLAFDTDDAAFETKFAVLADGKEGLLSLFDVEPVAFDPPAFVSADAAGVSMFRMHFDRIIPLFNQVMASLPPEEQAGMQQMSMMMVPMLEPILANIGPDVVIGVNYERPYSVDSQKQTWALRVKDQQTLTQALAGVFPMMGFQPRDFQGQQIWAPAPGGFIPAGQFAVGIGAGFLFLGPTENVENAMRQGGAEGAAGIADEDRFRAATRALSGAATMFSYSDTKQGLEWAEWYLKNFDEIMAEQMQAFEIEGEELDEEMRAQIEAMAREQTPIWLRSLPPLEIIGEYVGDSVVEARPTPSGFEGRMLWLRPAD